MQLNGTHRYFFIDWLQTNYLTDFLSRKKYTLQKEIEI